VRRAPRVLPGYVRAALVILARWQATQAPELRARVDPWLAHLAAMYIEPESGGARSPSSTRRTR
jgi:hypothetical protein